MPDSNFYSLISLYKLSILYNSTNDLHQRDSYKVEYDILISKIIKTLNNNDVFNIMPRNTRLLRANTSLNDISCLSKKDQLLVGLYIAKNIQRDEYYDINNLSDESILALKVLISRVYSEIAYYKSMD